MNEVTDGPAALPVDRLRAYMSAGRTHGGATQAVSEALREAILDGVLRPSAWLREDELATVFQVSRTPVREALRRLADEGLAVKTAHHGTVVAPLTLDDLMALYVVRVDLEGLAARLAAAAATSRLLAQLDEVHAEMAEAGARADTEALRRLNLQFHRLLREGAANSYLDRFLTQVEHAVRRVPSGFVVEGRAEQVQAEHAAVLEAVRRGDGDAAEQAARIHMRQAQQVRMGSMLAPLIQR